MYTYTPAHTFVDKRGRQRFVFQELRKHLAPVHRYERAQDTLAHINDQVWHYKR